MIIMIVLHVQGECGSNLDGDYDNLNDGNAERKVDCGDVDGEGSDSNDVGGSDDGAVDTNSGNDANCGVYSKADFGDDGGCHGGESNGEGGIDTNGGIGADCSDRKSSNGVDSNYNCEDGDDRDGDNDDGEIEIKMIIIVMTLMLVETMNVVRM